MATITLDRTIHLYTKGSAGSYAGFGYANGGISYRTEVRVTPPKNCRKITLSIPDLAYYSWNNKTFRCRLNLSSDMGAGSIETKTLLTVPDTGGAWKHIDTAITFEYDFVAGTTYHFHFYTDYSGAYAVCKHGNSITVAGELAYSSSAITMADTTLGSEAAIQITRVDSELRDTITYEVGDSSGTIAALTGAAELAWTPPLALAAENTTGMELECTLTVNTFLGEENVGSDSITVTLRIPASVAPTIGSATVTPQNTGGVSGVWIQGVSKAAAAITASAQYGATVDTYSLSVQGATISAGTGSLLSGILGQAGTFSTVVTITDSRGLTDTQSITITVLPYTSPAIVPAMSQIEILCIRSNSSGVKDPGGTYLRILGRAQYSSLDGHNTATMEYRVTRSGTVSAWASTDGDDVIDWPLYKTDTYFVELRITDTVGRSQTYSFDIPTEDIPLHLAQGGKSVGLGRFSGGRDHTIYTGWGIVLEEDESYGDTLPGSPVEGQMYLKREGSGYSPKIYDGSAWVGGGDMHTVAIPSTSTWTSAGDVEILTVSADWVSADDAILFDIQPLHGEWEDNIAQQDEWAKLVAVLIADGELTFVATEAFATTVYVGCLRL